MAAIADAVVHPRPQLTRPGWIDLSGSWGFAYDDDDRGLDTGWQQLADPFDRTITVPFPPESPASGINDTGFHPVVWYRRTVGLPARQDGDRVILHFCAVDYRAQVWVDGRLVASHEGGHTPFEADITGVLGEGSCVVTVRAEDDPHDLEQPRGKQDWQLEPHRIWYDRTTGIWQPVWLEVVPASRITRLRWTPDVATARLGVEISVQLAEGVEAASARVQLSLHGHPIADDVYAVTAGPLVRQLSLRQADMTLGRREVLWAPEYPNLIDATVTLLDRDGATLDEVGSYTAMRSIEAADGRVKLNERPYFLRLVLEQGFWPESHLAAPSADALRREVELIKELGFNGVRLHQKLEDPRFLYWCDRIGLLVWAEMPAAYDFSDIALRRLVHEWLDAIDRDYNHPCVIARVPVNESWGMPALEHSPAQRDAVRALYYLTKAADPTRLVIGNDGWEQIVSDVVTVHDYVKDAATLTERYGSRAAIDTTLVNTQPGFRSIFVRGHGRGDEPIIISEFGGITYAPENTGSWAGYGAVGSVDELESGYRALVHALLESPAIAGFCYTQLTDTQQERNGLLTEDRKCKVDPAVIRAITRRTAAAVPGDAIDAHEFKDFTTAAGGPSIGSSDAEAEAT